MPNAPHKTPELGVRYLDFEGRAPERSRPGDAGLDIFSAYDYWINPGENTLIRTAIALLLPVNTVGLIHSRSGLAAKHRVFVLNAPGVIDENYDGEILVNLMNLGPEPYHVRAGDRIAQLLLQTYIAAPTTQYEDRAATVRNGQGHGSSGR